MNNNHPRDEATLSRLEDPVMIARVVALLLSYGFRWPPPAPAGQPDDLDADDPIAEAA